VPAIINFSFIYKFSYFLFAVPTLLVIISAVLSSNAMGGTLGQGLKKIALGTIVDSILVTTYIFLERGSKGLLNQNIIRYFFLLSAIFASTFLIAGYIQVYKIAKRLKLFTL
jgi:hypothetical protein